MGSIPIARSTLQPAPGGLPHQVAVQGHRQPAAFSSPEIFFLLELGNQRFHQLFALAVGSKRQSRSGA
ncbi:MAG: hypothetical protein FJ316_05995 [SAR202 cluster bacterium]|nr:hypothetical protein [SAR202 cluster bacterium]